ncbi:MAG: GNAT family N-acetyltransferase [Acidimicrobiia bacterium]|nr:GNAT family N-acetyltransferase [Acidimicrobiia bacterium]
MTELHEEGLSDANLDEAIGFMRASNPFAQWVWGWDTGRFIDFRWGSNALRAAGDDAWFDTNCRIFRDGSAIVSMAIAEEGSEYVCIITKGAEPGLVAEVLALRIAAHRDRGVSISLEFTRDEEWLRQVCKETGLTEAVDTGCEWEYDLVGVDTAWDVPAGYRIETLATRPDTDRSGIGACIAAAFGSERDLESMVRSIEENPMFEPDLSVFAIDSAGTVAAYCRGTVDPDNGVCGIDPICTHPDHQKLGLGKAVVRRMFANQRRLGGRFAYIGSAPPPAPGTFLYRSLGPSRLFMGCEWSG